MALKALKDHIDPGGDRWDPVQCWVQYTINSFTFSPTDFLPQRPCPFTHNPSMHWEDMWGQKWWRWRWRQWQWQDIRRHCIIRQLQQHHIKCCLQNVGSHQAGKFNPSCLLHSLIHLSDTKIASSSCFLQADVSQGWCPRAWAHSVCMNSMGVNVCVSGSGTDTRNGA